MEARTVSFERLEDALPAAIRRVTPRQREEQLAARQRAYWQRFEGR